MSYVRFSTPGSDVYVFLNVAGFLSCCGCWLKVRPDASDFKTTAEMLAHLEEHQKAGHRVPDCVFDDLRADAESNDAWIASQATTSDGTGEGEG